VNLPAKFEVRRYRPIPVPDIIGVGKKIVDVGGREWYCSKEHWSVPIGPP